MWTQIRLLLCSGSTLFASIHNLSVMLGSYLQQMTSADDIFRCIFFLVLYGLMSRAKRNRISCIQATKDRAEQTAHSEHRFIRGSGWGIMISE